MSLPIKKIAASFAIACALVACKEEPLSHTLPNPTCTYTDKASGTEYTWDHKTRILTEVRAADGFACIWSFKGEFKDWAANQGYQDYPVSAMEDKTIWQPRWEIAQKMDQQTPKPVRKLQPWMFLFLGQ